MGYPELRSRTAGPYRQLLPSPLVLKLAELERAHMVLKEGLRRQFRDLCRKSGQAM